MNQWSDKELVSAVQQSEPWAFEELFNRYWHEMFQTAYRKVRSKEDAKDLVQEVWLSFWKQVPSIDIDESAAPYLFTALKNKTLHFLSKDKVRLAYVSNQLHVSLKSSIDTQDQLAVKELRVVVEEEVAQMPERMKEIYLLSRQAHLSVNEIAEKLQLSGQTVKNQLHNALERLRNRLSDYNANLLIILFLSIHVLG